MNKKTMKAAEFWSFLFLAACVIGLAVQPLAAQVTIPEGSTIQSAILHVHVAEEYNGKAVNVHRVTASWAETVVTFNSFGNAYNGAAEGSFTMNSLGWKTIDITSLVQAWAAGSFPNYGIALVEPTAGGTEAFSALWSSEYAGDLTWRPKLVIGYIPPGGSLTYVTIQRPGVLAEQVIDTWVSQLEPNTNFGTSPLLYIRNLNENNNKYALIQFIFSFVPYGPGTGTPGYWMNHPEAWPVGSITIGGRTYSQAAAIALMQAPVAKDKTLTMFAALVAAKLNVMVGNASSCVATTIAAADAWMTLYPAGFGVAAGGPISPWRTGEPLNYVLDQYNNGLLCAPHRD